MKVKIIGEALPNIPFEPKPAGTTAPVWRYSKNPIVKRNPTKNVARIYNSAVVPYSGEFVGVFRGDGRDGSIMLYFGKSKDGLHFEFEDERLAMVREDGAPHKLGYGYDPRLVKIEDTYYTTWCNSLCGLPTIGLAETTDFQKFVFKGDALLPFNRNGVLFPRKIGGEYALLSRPSDDGNTPYGDIFLSRSKDMTYWGRHMRVMRPEQPWERLKIGAGPIPIETDIGWVLLYHGVLSTCNGFVYSMGGAILDLDDPTKVLYRSKQYLLTPEESYETTGLVPNVVFPCAALTDADTGRIAIYYGAADTTLGIAFTTIADVVDFIIENSDKK